MSAACFRRLKTYNGCNAGLIHHLGRLQANEVQILPACFDVVFMVRIHVGGRGNSGHSSMPLVQYPTRVSILSPASSFLARSKCCLGCHSDTERLAPASMHGACASCSSSRQPVEHKPCRPADSVALGAVPARLPVELRAALLEPARRGATEADEAPGSRCSSASDGRCRTHHRGCCCCHKWRPQLRLDGKTTR